jgi:hypothetical protein
VFWLAWALDSAPLSTLHPLSVASAGSYGCLREDSLSVSFMSNVNLVQGVDFGSPELGLLSLHKELTERHSEAFYNVTNKEILRD